MKEAGSKQNHDSRSKRSLQDIDEGDIDQDLSPKKKKKKKKNKVKDNEVELEISKVLPLTAGVTRSGRQAIVCTCLSLYCYNINCPLIRFEF